MRRKGFTFSILSCILGFFLTGCGTDETTSDSSFTENESEGNGSISVVTTFYPVYEFTQQIAGERADVSVMITGGTDAHGYEPSAQAVAEVNDADVFVYSSEEMETWVPSLLDTVENDDLVVISQAEQIDFLETAEDSHSDEEDSDHENDDTHNHSHQLDPHIWLDPVLAQSQVETILEGLIEADPQGQAYYETEAERFIGELQALHEEYEEAFEGAENRTFITQHESFGYIAQRYDLEQIAVGGLSSEVEPSPSRIAEIGGLVQEYNVPVIYYQQGANSAIAQTVASETGTEIAILHDLEVLSEELMEQDLGYLDAMRQNLEALQLSIQ